MTEGAGGRNQIDLASERWSYSLLPSSRGVALWLLCVVRLCVVQIPLGLLQGRVTHIVWPPSRWGRVRSSLEDERVKKPDNFRTI